MKQFANQGNNLTKLNWDLSKPETWNGIQWIYANNEYYVQEISISDLSLTGNLNISGMEHLIRVFCDNNNLTAIDVSGSNRLSGLYCRNAGIRNLNISNTASLTVLDCEENYLNLSDIIADIYIIETRENAWVSYINQKLLYDFVLTTPGLIYDETSQELILDTIQFTAELTCPQFVGQFTSFLK